MHRARGSCTCSRNRARRCDSCHCKCCRPKPLLGQMCMQALSERFLVLSLACTRLKPEAAGEQTKSLRRHRTVGLPQAPAHQPLSARGGSCPIWPVASSSWLARDSRARGDTAPPPPAGGVLRWGRGASLRGGRRGGPAGTRGPASLPKQSAGLSLLQATLRRRWRPWAVQV